MDDEFGLLPDQQGAPPPPRRPIGLILGGLVLVALVTLAAAFWLASSLGNGREVVAAGTPAPAPTTTATPTPTPTPTPTFSMPPVTTVPPTTVAPTSVPPATTTPKPVPTTRPVPRPTASVPIGRLVRVPNVVGLRVQRAITLLQASGLRVQVIGGVQDPERDNRRVVAQRPTAGTVTVAGFTVILVTDGT